MERKEGRGRPGALTELPSPKEQGSSKTTPEGGKDYRGMLSSIKANQGLKTFVTGLCQNKEQLLSVAQELTSGQAVPAKTKKEAKDNTALGIYMDFAVRYISNPSLWDAFEVFSTNPADWRDEYTSYKPMTEAEKRELGADRAARRQGWRR